MESTAAPGGRSPNLSAQHERRSLTHTVAGNTLWYGLELVVGIAAAFLISIPMARILGPERLSYFTYLQWLTNVGGMLGMAGLPAMTRKYMAEHLGRGDAATASSIYHASLRLQTWLALGVLAAGAAIGFRFARPGYGPIAALLLAAVAAKLIGNIPSSANMAAEDMRANFLASLAGSFSGVVLVNLSLLRGWGLAAIAASLATSAAAEMTAKLLVARRAVLPDSGRGIPPELRARIRTFSGQALALLAIQIVVWDRSDLLFLKWLGNDPRQITFFAVAFNLTEKMLLIPQAFTAAIGASLMAEYGRSREKLYRTTAAAAKYSLLVAMPMMFGLAAISDPIIRWLYGSQYIPAIPVLAIAAVLACLKPLLGPMQSLMQAEERQAFLIRWGLVCAALNIALDVLLIPLGGARGAMLANGLAQGAGAAGVWVRGVRAFPIQVPLRQILGVSAAAALSAACAFAVVRSVDWPPPLEIAAAVPAAGAVYLVALRLTRALDAADMGRLRQLATRLPGPLRRSAERLLAVA